MFYFWNSGNSHNQAIRNWNCNILRVLKFPVINFTDFFSDVIGQPSTRCSEIWPTPMVSSGYLRSTGWRWYVPNSLEQTAVVEGVNCVNCVQFTASFHEIEKFYRKIMVNYGKMSRGTRHGKEMQEMQAKSCLLGKTMTCVRKYGFVSR